MIGAGVGAGIAVYGMIQAEKAKKRAQAAEKKALAFRTKLSGEYADDELRKGLAQADLIRFEAIKFRGQQAAQQAASGVVVGNGSAKAIRERTIVLSEADALVAIEESKNKAKRIMDSSALDALETATRIEGIGEKGKQQQISTASNIATSFG